MVISFCVKGNARAGMIVPAEPAGLTLRTIIEACIELHRIVIFEI